MRYLDDVDGVRRLADAQVPVADQFVPLTVWMTLVIGVLFTIVGFRAKQRWLLFWGLLTIVACACYAAYVFQT